MLTNQCLLEQVKTILIEHTLFTIVPTLFGVDISPWPNVHDEGTRGKAKDKTVPEAGCLAAIQWLKTSLYFLHFINCKQHCSNDIVKEHEQQMFFVPCLFY